MSFGKGSLASHWRLGLRYLFLRAALVVLTVSSLPLRALAWGDVGHELVCQIAYKELTPATRTKLGKIMSADASAHGLKTKTFAVACTHPDHPHVRGDDHFINVPRNTAHITTEDCGANATCLFSAIKEDLAKFSDSSVSNADRKLALSFLGHWAGDIHQPLHVSFADDRGGNEITATGKCASPDYGSVKLHAVWDVCLVDQPRGIVKADLTNGPKIATIRTEAQKLQQGITAANRTDWGSTGPVQWADESLQAAAQTTTDYCTKENGACDYEHGNEEWATGETKRSVTADQAYIDANKATVDGRLQRAGVRLAKLIEDALGSEHANLSAPDRPDTVAGPAFDEARSAASCTPRAQCCKVCVKGQACGATCISASYTCHVGRGCACNASEICQ